MKNGKKIISFFTQNNHGTPPHLFMRFFVFLIAVVLLTGCTHKIFSQPKEGVVTTTQNSTATSTVDTSDWLTYENKEYGFSFRYPKIWKVKILDEVTLGLVSPELEEELKTNPTIFNSDLYINIKSPITKADFITQADGFKGSLERAAKNGEIRGLQFVGENRARFIEYNSFLGDDQYIHYILINEQTVIVVSNIFSSVSFNINETILNTLIKIPS